MTAASASESKGVPQNEGSIAQFEAKPSWAGHRGIVECMDCGHIWSSILEGVPSWKVREIREEKP